jgi:hypothetical protein
MTDQRSAADRDAANRHRRVGFTIEESDRLRAGVVERLVARERDARA